VLRGAGHGGIAHVVFPRRLDHAAHAVALVAVRRRRVAARARPQRGSEGHQASDVEARGVETSAKSRGNLGDIGAELGLVHGGRRRASSVGRGGSRRA